MAPLVPRTRKAHAPPPVVELARARSARRLRDLQARCQAVDEMNRKSLVRLFQSGLVYTRQGARLGRDLLLAHQHLLRVSDLLARIAEVNDGASGETSSLYDEAQGLLARTAELTARTGLVLARGQ
jgi:hypothetical protein